MSKDLPSLTAAGALTGAEQMLVSQSSNPRRTTAVSVAALSATAANAPALNLLDFITQSEWAAITAYTSTFDCYSALIAAIAALPANGGMILFPPGKYNFSATIDLKKVVHFIGAGSGEANSFASWLAWAQNKTGIVVNTFNTQGGVVISPATTGADASIFEGLYLTCASGGTTGHGIHLRARAEIRNCHINGFPQDGIHIEASVSSDDAGTGNANNWLAYHCRIENCGRHGMYVVGSDVNAGNALAMSAANNGGWGFYDSSFLGNSYTGCHTEGNTLGGYKTDVIDSRNVFQGCYSESGQPASDINGPSVVIGGLHAAGFGTGTGRVIADAGIRGGDTPFQTLGPTQGGSRTLSTQLGGDGFPLKFWTDSDAPVGIFWNEATGTFDIAGGLRLPTVHTVTVDENSNVIGGIILPATVYIDSGNGFSAHSFKPRWASSIPSTSGTAARGDIVYNTAPTAGGVIGWVCVSTGTPDVWKTFGAISA